LHEQQQNGSLISRGDRLLIKVSHQEKGSSELLAKLQYFSNGQTVGVKFHTNIANRWLFVIQRKIMAIILYS